jgi:predicted O-methyltransferase YrrM
LIDAMVVPPLVMVAEKRALDEEFDMSSGRETGMLLRTLAASKPGGLLLELGTGVGVGSGWLLDGMDSAARLLTLEVHPEAAEISRTILAPDPRVEVVHANGCDWLEAYSGRPFDLIFVDVGILKYERRALTLSRLAAGGLFVCDDLIWQPTWDPAIRPSRDRVERFRTEIFTEPGLRVTLMDWGAGICVATRVADDAPR